MPKRKAEDEDSAPKGKKTTMSKKTTVTTVTIEDEPSKKPKPKNDPASASSSSKKNQTKGKKSPGPMALHGGGAHLSLPPASLQSGVPGLPGMFLPNYGFPGSISAPVMSLPLTGHVGRNSPPAPMIMPIRGYPLSSQSAHSAPYGQMPMQSFGESSKTSSSSAVARPKKAEGGGGGGVKFVWIVYHKSGRQDSQLMGVYTAAKTALKNAKAVIDRETGGAQGRIKEGADFNDFSSNIQADQGSIYEVKYVNGGKNVVSFKKVKLNEDLGENLDGDDDDDSNETGCQWRSSKKSWKSPDRASINGLPAIGSIGWL